MAWRSLFSFLQQEFDGGNQLKNFDRQYRLSAGKAGKEGFEIGAVRDSQSAAMHVNFSVQKQDLETSNSAKISVWNLNKTHLTALAEKDCVITLKAGYGNNLPLIFTGIVSFTETRMDGADRVTEIEAVDSLIEIRDTYVALSYAGPINTKKIIDDLAAQMGVTVSYSYNAAFAEIPNGFSFVGQAKDVLNKLCAVSGRSWSLQNGILQVKKINDVMSREVYVMSAETGLIDIPKRVQIASDNKKSKPQVGYDITYLMNGAIGIDDYIRLESKSVTGYFRIYSLNIEGDNISGVWQCTARILEV